MAADKNHIWINQRPDDQQYQSPRRGGKSTFPSRDRGPHGRKLLRALANVRDREAQQALARAQQNLPLGGTTIVLELTPKGQAIHHALEWRRDGIEVLRVSDAGNSEIVTLFVPEGRLGALEKRLNEYLTKETPKGRPRNATLVNLIEDIRSARFEEFWSSESDPPEFGDVRWFQVWLRAERRTGADTHALFTRQAVQLGIDVERGYVMFPGRVVVAVSTTREILQSALELMDLIAEIRPVETTAEFFLTDLTPADQAEWARELRGRTTAAQPDAITSYVTLLDTGVNIGHPLISPSLQISDLHAVDTTWTATDQWGHGTQMAGLILHGNLVHPLASQAPHTVGYRLESIKILPDTGVNAPHLFGWITSQATKKVEAAATGRRRTFAMMTSAVGVTTGLPSEWSATIDRLAFGAIDAASDDQVRVQSFPRLFVLSAGNVPWDQWIDYPNRNDLMPVESPGQAWNALTVGAVTHLGHVDTAKWPNLQPIANPGTLSPSSTTSVNWARSWPSKPDVVAEGGNGCVEHGLHVIVGPESLRMLTTSHEVSRAMFVETGDTSAAAAQAARLCGQLTTKYPHFWPETVRALVIHGARYTPEMLAPLPTKPLREHKELLRRRYGYGEIQPGISLFSSEHRATLILQNEITPYQLRDGDMKLNSMHMYALPWPQEVLAALGQTEVLVRVTLSYFIDPNPSQRGWQGRFRYQSHGLRFAIQGATETAAEFNQRINKLERDVPGVGEESTAIPDPDVDGWMFGSQVRSQGSVHSDSWSGTAAQLAAKNGIAVYPVGGWWKDWKANPYAGTVRYALIISIEVPESIEVDIYTPIAVQVPVPVTVEVA